MHHHINTPRRDLTKAVIDILREAGPLDIEQIHSRQTITRHHRRIGSVIEHLERKGLVQLVEWNAHGNRAKQGYALR